MVNRQLALFETPVVEKPSWKNPLYRVSLLIPLGKSHPGRFGAVRKHDIHTGVDLYCPEGTIVQPVEDGVVVARGRFTGESIGMPWWEETDYIAIKGNSGVVLYGELSLGGWRIGEKVVAGEAALGTVKRVLKRDKGRPMSMLHLELYSRWNGSWESWELGSEKPKNLLDPTYLLSTIR
jgi:hypothetical protein